MCAGRASLFIDSTNKTERRTPMDNFEARYLAIVEKNQELHHPEIFNAPSGNWMCGKTDLIPGRIAREAVCWWLERQAIKHFGGPREYWDFIVRFIGFGCYTVDPSGAVLTTWEIILRIKR